MSKEKLLSVAWANTIAVFIFSAKVLPLFGKNKFGDNFF